MEFQRLDLHGVGAPWGPGELLEPGWYEEALLGHGGEETSSEFEVLELPWRRLYSPSELELAAKVALEAHLPDWSIADVMSLYKHPDIMAPFYGSWRTLPSTMHHDLPHWRHHAYTMRHQDFYFASPRSSKPHKMQCEVSTGVRWRDFGEEQVVDHLNLFMVYGPDGPGLRGQGHCGYLVTTSYMDVAPECQYSFFRRSEDLYISLSYMHADRSVQKAFLASRQS